MSEYVIKADGGYTQLNVTEINSETNNFASLSAVGFDYNDISTSEFQRMWSSSGGYIDAQFTSATRVDNRYNNMIGSTITSSGGSYDVLIPTPHLFVFSFVWGTDLYIMWENASSIGDLINKMEGFSGIFPATNTLYKNTVENAKSQNIMLEDNWDESPSADENDPDRTLPQGGAFADTNPFGFGNTDIDVPDTVQELDYSGFITAYQLDNGEIFALGESIFTSNTWQDIKLKYDGIGDPISYIISAVEIPYDARGGTKNFNLGGVAVRNSGGNNVPIHTIDKRYHLLSFGSINLKETWGTEKDYSSTDVAIYLPYVGVKDLDTSILMNSTLTLKAFLDAWSGDLLYLLVVDNKSAAYKYLGSHGIVYRFQGNCGKQVPIGRTDNSNQVMAMTGAMASMGVGLMSGNPMMALGGAAGLIGAGAITPKVSMAGGVTGSIGRADVSDAYLIIKQSVPVYPSNWRAHFGAPRYQEFTLSDLSGYVKCSDVHADSIEGANDAERAAIEQALKAGVFMS